MTKGAATSATQTDVAEVEAALSSTFGGRWIGWEAGSAGPNTNLWVRLDEIGGRWTVTAVLMMGRTVTGSDLRKVPIGTIENAVNLGVDRAEDQARAELAQLPPLVRDSAMDPVDWSKLVARHFTAWAKAVPHPAAAMAAEWKVNRQTVNAWVREARLRGFLPPARRGRAADPKEILHQQQIDIVARMPAGPSRDAAFDALRRHHRGED